MIHLRSTLCKLAVVAQLGAVTAFSQQPFDLDQSFRLNVQEQTVRDVLSLENNTILITGRFKFPGDEYYRTGSLIDIDGNALEEWQIGGRIKRWGSMFYGSSGGNSVVRLFGDGSSDQQFWNNITTYTGPQGGDFHVYDDGRLLISGSHLIDIPEANLSGLYELVWVKTSGHLDTLRTPRKSDGVIFEIEEQPDGKFLCTGTMSTYENAPVTRIFRIHSDGDLDTTFQAEIDQWGEAFGFLTLPDGKILAAGVFRTADQQDTLCVIRMHSNGQLDNSFQHVRCDVTIETGFGYALHLYRLPDGRVIMSGKFDQVNGQERGAIAMLSEDGELMDDVFSGEGCGQFSIPGEQSPRKSLSGIRPAPDGSFYIFGSYHGYDDGATNDPSQRLVSRLFGLTVGIREAKLVVLQMHPNPTNSSVTIALPEGMRNAELIVHDALGRVVHQQRIAHFEFSLAVGGWPAGLYQVHVLGDGSSKAAGKLMIE